MNNYNYQKQLKAIWEKAVNLYQAGQRRAETYFDTDETNFLDTIGVSAQEVYDFAEDFVAAGEPDFTTFAMVHDIRRSYFLERQKGIRSEKRLDSASLPPKDSSVRGISWLPRIIAKANAKLRGELHPDIMYCCGGDRAFLKANDIQPAEFLRVVGENEEDDEAIIDWVVARREKAQQRRE